jgi:hypothetical protein
MNRNLERVQLDVVHSVASASPASANQIVVIAEGIRADLFKFCLVAALGWGVCRVLGLRINATSIGIVKDCLELFLGLGGLKNNILVVVRGPTDHSVGDGGAALPGIHDASGAGGIVDLTRARDRRLL